MNALTFDLTTPEGRRKALEAFDKFGWIPFPSFWILRQAWKLISESTISTLEAQKNTAIDLIEAGKANGVDEMTITLDQTVGLDLGSEVKGVPIKLKMGVSGRVDVWVKYK